MPLRDPSAVQNNRREAAAVKLQAASRGNKQRQQDAAKAEAVAEKAAAAAKKRIVSYGEAAERSRSRIRARAAMAKARHSLKAARCLKEAFQAKADEGAAQTNAAVRVQVLWFPPLRSRLLVISASRSHLCPSFLVQRCG